MPTTKLIIEDEVNIRFTELPPKVRRELNAKVKYFMHHAKFLPAYKLGRWDGCKSFCTIGGASYLNLLDKLIPIVDDAGYEIEIIDQRHTWEFNFDPISDTYLADQGIVWHKEHQLAGKPIMLRDYQVEAINKFLTNPQCVSEISTGAGKTLISSTLAKCAEKYGKTIIIVPNTTLVEQTEADYKSLGLDVGVYYGNRKEPGHTHTICTWQSINVLDKKDITPDDVYNINTIIDGLVCVMVDECHQASADVLLKLMTGPFKNVPIRWGMTGTIPKEEYKYVSILSSIGPVINQLKAKELQDNNVLANCHINIIQLVDTKEFRTYPEESKFLHEDELRLAWMADFIQKIASEDGNTFVLLNKIATGKRLSELIPDSVFVQGATKSKDRKSTYDEAKVFNNKIILGTYGIGAVGIDIPRLFNIVLIEPGKSFVRTIQSIGRGLRKAADKDSVDVYDITSTCKFSRRHLTERKKFYTEAQYPFKITKVEYRQPLLFSKNKQ